LESHKQSGQCKLLYNHLGCRLIYNSLYLLLAFVVSKLKLCIFLSMNVFYWKRNERKLEPYYLCDCDFFFLSIYECMRFNIQLCALQALFSWHLVQVILIPSLDCCMGKNGVMVKHQQSSAIIAFMSLFWLWMVIHLVSCCSIFYSLTTFMGYYDQNISFLF
jgi:hypothetical protein